MQKSIIAVITEFLQNRRQAVRINDQVPRLHAVSGVPQGSLLGHLIFLIFINDLTDSIFFPTAYLFADDLKLCISTSESERLDLSRDIEANMEWISTNQMQLNISKCQFLPLLSSRHEPIALDTITLSRRINDLGLKKRVEP